LKTHLLDLEFAHTTLVAVWEPQTPSRRMMCRFSLDILVYGA